MPRFICFALLIAVAIGCSRGKKAKSEPGDQDAKQQSTSVPNKSQVNNVGFGTGASKSFDQGVGIGKSPVAAAGTGVRPAPKASSPSKPVVEKPEPLPSEMLDALKQALQPIKASVEYFTKSRVLRITITRARLPRGTLKRLEPYANYITSLLILACEIDDLELQSLPELPWLNDLELNASKGFTDVGISHLPRMKRLLELDLSLTSTNDAGLAALAGLSGIESLRTLRLQMTRVSDAGLKNLSPLKGLQFLALDQTQVVGSGLKDLAPLTKLRNLTMHQSSVTNAGIANMPTLPALEWINLERTGIGDEGLGSLIKQNPTLVDFDLGGTRVTDAGAKLITELPKCRRVNLYNTRVTKEGIALIKTKFPKAVVVAP